MADFLPFLLVEPGLERARGLPLNPNTDTESHAEGALSNSNFVPIRHLRAVDFQNKGMESPSNQNTRSKMNFGYM